jgi:predicted nucleic acid-binding protein
MRSQVAETLLAAGGALSVQVLNEFVVVARRKLDKNWEEVRRALDILRVFCPEPVPLTVKTHERALDIAERYGYSIFDSLIIAAALHAGASTLYSEDMQDGQAIDGLTIRNPFWRHAKRSRPSVGEITSRTPAEIKHEAVGVAVTRLLECYPPGAFPRAFRPGPGILRS